MNGYTSVSLLRSSKKRRALVLLLAVIAVLTGIAVLCSIPYINSNRFKQKPPAVNSGVPVAELISATGMILVGKAGTTEWHQVLVGATLMEGDLIQTDRNGEACIRFSNGNTVAIQESTIFTVQSATDTTMEISAPALEESPMLEDANLQAEGLPLIATGPDDGNAVEAFNAEIAGESIPYIKLDMIIPFGRSLELVGKVEAGSRLAVNGEAVDVGGDGSFKHFTNPFPSSVDKARLILKVTDLAGRTRAVAAVHDFSIRGRSH